MSAEPAPTTSGQKELRPSEFIRSIDDDPVVGRYLKQVPLLARLTDVERSKLGGALEVKVTTQGQDIFKQGDDPDGFYIIKKGQVSVWAQGPNGTRCDIAKLQDGDYFGETALQDSGKKRGATITAESKVCELYFMSAAKFSIMFEKNRLAVNFVSRRVAISAEMDLGGSVPKFKSQGKKVAMSPQVQTTVLQIVSNSVLFNKLSDKHKRQVCAAMLQVEVKKGEAIIKQGEAGTNFYAIESGSFDIFVRDKFTKIENRVASRGAGESFGELALMYNAPRAATVVATTDATLWSVDRYTFRRIAQDLGQSRLKQYIEFMKGVPLLSTLAGYERAKLAEALEEISFAPDQVIFKQGDTIDSAASMYVVADGAVTCLIDGKEVKVCKVGDYFGEKALLENKPRAATVKARGRAHCLRLDRPAFDILLGPLEEILKRGVAAYTEPQEEKAPMSFLRTDIKREDLVTLGTLGKGSFGHVTLVKHKHDGTAYALKAVSKQQVVESRQKGHIISEKRTLAMLSHPFIIRLYATYKDKDRLFFLLEPSLGGELFTVLRKHRLFPEPTAKFYAASVISAFEYMHSLNIVYRDLKPENLLLDADGFIKVTDFGFAKRIRYKTDTLCGTPEYLAPEIVAGNGHGKGVDWWTVGILIFEMLASFTPFYHENNMVMYSRIAKAKIRFPAHFSMEARQIIKGLLTNAPTRRLGIIKGGADKIKASPWFSGFDFDALFAKKVRPPIKPKIANNFDLSNFEDYGVDDDGIRPYVDDGTNWDKDF